MIPDIAPADDEDITRAIEFGFELVCERLDALGTADDDDVVARFQHGVTSGDNDAVITQHGGEGERLVLVCLLDGSVGDRARLGDVELRHLDQFVGEGVDVLCGRHADDVDCSVLLAEKHRLLERLF